MKIIKCESGKLINADHIVSIERIYQQGLNKHAVVARTVLDDLITIYQCNYERGAETVIEVLYRGLSDESCHNIDFDSEV